MARKRKGRPINGVILVDKYTGESSNFVLQQVKRCFGAAKAGHTGALDPLATGMLPICLGEATKFSQFLLEANKTYITTAKLGQRTDTSDCDGEIVETKEVSVTKSQLESVLQNFRGKIKQIPSMFSALKHQGKPLYSYARQGITIEREARDIEIFELTLLRFEGDEVDLKVSCSKGTYIRSLVDDIGQMLGCGAHVSMLRRTQVADYPAEQMISMPELLAMSDKMKADAATHECEPKYDKVDDLLLPMDTAVLDLASVDIDESKHIRFNHGQAITVDQSFSVNQQVRVYTQNDKRFLGIATVDEQQKLQPKRVVVYPSTDG